MKKIILATGNEGKVRELNAMLKDNYNVISQNDMQVKEDAALVLTLTLAVHAAWRRGTRPV